MHKMYMKQCRNKNRNAGAAMVVAIIVSVVMMVFCLSLLLVSYSLFSTTMKDNVYQQCKSMAESLSLELEKELSLNDVSSIEDMEALLNNPTGSSDLFWLYLRFNLCQDNWPYLNAEESGHDAESAYRYFTLDYTIPGGTDYNPGCEAEVCIYWDSSAAQVAATNDDTTVHVLVTVDKGDSTYSVESVYTLNVSTDYSMKGPESLKSLSNATVNPAGNTIDVSETWNFTLRSRE